MALALEQFTSRYPAQAPQKPHENPDQLRLLDAADGVDELDGAPARSQAGPPNDPSTRHLWVITPRGAPYVQESAPGVRTPLASGVAKHTNLTGGAPACCGGELWIDLVSAAKLYVSGASGRYRPRTLQQLEDAIDVLRGRGFTVQSCGWDDDVDLPARVFR